MSTTARNSKPVSRQGANGGNGEGVEDSYRDKWRWDKVFWATHCVDCYPGNCPYRVYVRNGKVTIDEAAGVFPVIEENVPDANPMGCQKGAAWSRMLDAPERVLHPLKRAGERGEGKWEQITWDRALTEIADHMLDAIEEVGPKAIVRGTPGEGGLLTGIPSAGW